MTKFNSVQMQCEQCGKQITRQPNEIKRNKHNFCSRKCRAEYQSVSISGENNPSYKGHLLTLTCNSCGKQFQRTRTNVLPYKEHFCSLACKFKGMSRRLSGKNNPLYKGKVSTICIVCGKPITRHPSHIQKGKHKITTCSPECRVEWISQNQSGENSPQWKGGAIYDYGDSWKKQRRKTAKRDNHTCQHCGITEKEYKRKTKLPLDVHHIRKFRDFGFVRGENRNDIQANDLKNLILLCRSCHHKAEFGQIPIQPKII